MYTGNTINPKRHCLIEDPDFCRKTYYLRFGLNIENNMFATLDESLRLLVDGFLQKILVSGHKKCVKTTSPWRCRLH